MDKKGLLIDVTLCVGCGGCVDACREANGLPKKDKPSPILDAENYCALQEHAGRNVRRLCMHCENPACVSVCPVGAFQKTAAGPVVYDVDRCMGCRYCMVACPWDVPKYEWANAVPRVRKCILCYGRVREGKPTACSEACPTGATTFGNRADLLAEAKKRIAAEPKKYEGTVLGEREVGGTSVLFIADVAFVKLGFPADLPQERLPEKTHQVLSKLPGVLLVGGAFLYGMHWLTDRKNELAGGESSEG
jgi:formate dehydrogenase iron-sulfur subunit